MRVGSALFLIIETCGLEREGGAPVQKINHVSAVYFSVFAFQCSGLGAGGKGFAHKLFYLADSKGAAVYFAVRQR